MNFAPELIQQARKEIRFAPYGTKSEKAKQWAAILGVSMQHVYRIIEEKIKQRLRTGAVNQDYHNWAEIIFQIKKRPPEEAGEISTEDAVSIAVKQGLIPATAADVAAGTFDRIARKNGWTKTSVRAVRFQAERPNQAHHFDASTSKFLYIAKKVGDEYILKLHRPAKHYKNKPIPVDALRPWIYGLVDDHSGRLISRYTPAQGENSGDSMSFLSWAWSDFGLPEQLLADQGMLKKALPSRDLIERLGVELPECMPYAKRAHGKIERPWRSTWQKFELTFFASDTDWSKFEISMNELNSQLTNFFGDKYNQLPHRFERDITRMQAWNRINLYGGVVKIPENALATVARRAKRKVGIDGILNYENKAFEVKGLHDAWVYIFEGVFDDRLVVQDIETGKKYEVQDFKPLNLGEYKAFTATPHEEIVKQSAELQLASAGLYASRLTPYASQDKVISMPIRTKEEREIEDPFDIDSYPNMAEAMQDFMSYLPGVFLKPDDREVIEQQIKDNGLSRTFVENFALEFRAQMLKRAVM